MMNKRTAFLLFFYITCKLNYGKNDFILNLKGINLWLISDSVVCDSNSNVLIWKDYSSTLNNAKSVTLQSVPKFLDKIALLNGKGSVLFDGNSDLLEINPIDSVQSAFLVFKHRTGNQNYASVFGNSDPNLQNWHGNSGTGLIYPYPLTQNVLQGQGFVNGVNTPVALMVKPTQYSIYSFITAGPTSVATIGSSFNLYYWDGDIAEIILYNRQLDSTERVGVEQYLRNKYAPPVSLGGDQNLTSYCPVTLDVSNRFLKYRWNTGDTSSSINVSKSGVYKVTTQDVFGFYSTDSVKIQFPIVNGEGNAAWCAGNSYTWNTGLSNAGYQFHWQDGSSDSLRLIPAAGTYSVTITDTKGCSYVSSATVKLDSFPTSANIGRGNTYSFCHGGKLNLVEGGIVAQTFHWSDGSGQSQLYPINSGTYSLTVTDNNGCVAHDSAVVQLKPGSVPHSIVKVSSYNLCLGATDTLLDNSYTTDGSQVTKRFWSLGDGKTSLNSLVEHSYDQPNDTGLLTIRLSDTTTAGCYNDTVFNVYVSAIPSAGFSFSTALVNKLVQFTPSVISNGSIYNWSFGDTVNNSLTDTSSSIKAVHNFKWAGSYQVGLTVSNKMGCSSTQTQQVSVGFDPSSFSGLGLWLRGDSGVTADANKDVSVWKDYSGNGNDAKQSTISNEPILVDSIGLLNNKPVLRFNGIGDYMAFNRMTNIRDCYFVVKHNGTQDYPPLLGDMNTFDFAGEAGKLLFNEQHDSPFLLNGQVWGNEQLDTVSLFTKPMNYEIIAISPTDNLSASQITNDRGVFYWAGDFAEIILYNRQLDSLERVGVEQYLLKKYAPPVNLGGDRNLSSFCPYNLVAGDRFLHYKWNTGDTTQSIAVTRTGVYKVTTQDVFGFYSTDSVLVTFPKINGQRDTLLCLGSSLTWNTGLSHSGYKFHWQDGSSDSLNIIPAAGNYSVTITDTKGCSFVSTELVKLDSFPVLANIGRGNTYSFCHGGKLNLVEGGIVAQTFHWSDGSGQSQLYPINSGTYSLTVTDNNGCVAHDSAVVQLKPGSVPHSIVKVSSYNLCLGATDTLLDNSYTTDGSQVTKRFWSLGDGKTSLNSLVEHSYDQPNDTGLLTIRLSDTTTAGCYNDTVFNVYVSAIPSAGFSFSTALVNKLVQFTPSVISNGSIYNWSFGDTVNNSLTDTSSSIKAVHNFKWAGSYQVGLTVSNKMGCSSTQTQQVSVGFDPSSFSGLGLWLRGDSGVTADANKDVSVWKDYSGNGNDAKQSTISNEPILVDSIGLLNNKPVLRFNGIGDYMAFNRMTNIRDCYFVVKHNGTQDYPPLLGDMNTFDFAGEAGKLLFNEQHDSPFLLNGQVWGNEQLDTVSLFTKPMNYEIIAISPTDNLSASQITNDRGVFYWAGDFAEIILYNRQLDSLERVGVEQYLLKKYAPPVNLGGDRNLSSFCPYNLVAGDRFLHYKWNTGDTTQSIAVTRTGVYKVTTQDVFGFYSTDSVLVTFPKINGQRDTLLCLGSSLTWNTGLSHSGYKFHWQDGSSDSLITTGLQQILRLLITDVKGCTFEDSSFVRVDNFSILAKIPRRDTSLCLGNRLELNPIVQPSLSQIKWSTGTTKSYFLPQSPGTYSVIATDSNGCHTYDSINVKIRGKAPKANFIVTGKFCIGDTIKLLDQSLPTDKSNLTVGWWVVNFSDTLPSGQNQIVLNSNINLNPLQVQRCVATDAGCTNDTVIPFNVYKTPVISFTPNLLCSGHNILFSITDTLYRNKVSNWSWNFGDGSVIIQDTVSTVQHNFKNSGSYSVGLKLTTALGCSSFANQQLLIKQSPKARLSLSNACLNQPTTFADESLFGNTVSLNFGDGSPFATQLNGIHFYSQVGKYALDYVVHSNNLCTDTFKRQVIIAPSPIANYRVLSPVCQGSPIQLIDSSATFSSDSLTTFTWMLNDTVIATTANPIFSITSPGLKKLTLTVSDTQGCQSQPLSQQFTVNPMPNANFSFTTSNMWNEPPISLNLTATDTSMSTYNWSWGASNKPLTDSISGQQTLIGFNQTGAYTIQLMVQASTGCQNTSQQFLNLSTPVFDVKLLSVTPQLDSLGYLGATLFFENNSNRNLQNMQIQVAVNGQAGDAELWTGNLIPGGIANFTMHSKLQLQETANVRFVCINLTFPDGFLDANPQDNQICASLSGGKFQVAPVFPNPASSFIQIPIIVPNSGQIQLTIFSTDGSIAFNQDALQVSKGVNNIGFQVGNWADGLYYYRVNYAGNVQSGRFVKE